MMFVTMAEAAETLDTTEAGVEQLMRARVLQPATQLERAARRSVRMATVRL